jgi:hypothetical protein
MKKQPFSNDKEFLKSAVQPTIPAVWQVRQENHEFNVSLGCTATILLLEQPMPGRVVSEIPFFI